MKTQLVGLKEFRQNIASYSKRIQSHKVRYLVLRKNKPIFEVKAVDKDDIMKEILICDIARAREDIKAGRFISHKQLKKKYGLS